MRTHANHLSALTRCIFAGLLATPFIACEEAPLSPTVIRHVFTQEFETLYVGGECDPPSNANGGDFDFTAVLEDFSAHFNDRSLTQQLNGEPRELGAIIDRRLYFRSKGTYPLEGYALPGDDAFGVSGEVAEPEHGDVVQLYVKYLERDNASSPWFDDVIWLEWRTDGGSDGESDCWHLNDECFAYQSHFDRGGFFARRFDLDLIDNVSDPDCEARLRWKLVAEQIEVPRPVIPNEGRDDARFQGSLDLFINQVEPRRSRELLCSDESVELTLDLGRSREVRAEGNCGPAITWSLSGDYDRDMRIKGTIRIQHPPPSEIDVRMPFQGNIDVDGFSIAFDGPDEDSGDAGRSFYGMARGDRDFDLPTD